VKGRTELFPSLYQREGQREGSTMTKHYNKKSEQEKRRLLRSKMTYCEKIVWLHLRKKQLGYRFLRQYSVDQFVIDFYCPKLKLAVELDGDVHEVLEQKEYDIKRQKYLEEFGIKFIRIKNEEFLGNPNKAFDKIEEEIRNIKENAK
jgi:very-short-patch-repair endonuclease